MAAMAEGADTGEQKGRNVSQVINLAVIQMKDGQFQTALDTLGSMGTASEFGAMFTYRIMACYVASEPDNPTLGFQYEDIIRFMEANWEDNPGALQDAYLCGDLEEKGADLMIRRLARKEMAYNVLLGFQTFDDGVSTDRNLPFADLLSERRKKLRARPDVLEAAEAVGRIRTFDLQ